MDGAGVKTRGSGLYASSYCAANTSVKSGSPLSFAFALFSPNPGGAPPVPLLVGTVYVIESSRGRAMHLIDASSTLPRMTTMFSSPLRAENVSENSRGQLARERVKDWASASKSVLLHVGVEGVCGV